MNKTLVIGLGNPLLGDDGVGWRVAQALAEMIDQKPDCLPPEVDFDCQSTGGLALMERLVGYDRGILIDAIQTGRCPPGQVSVFALEELDDPGAGHSASVHDASLLTALKLGRALEAHLPDQVMVVAIEAQSVYDFGEQMTPMVTAAVPEAAQAVISLLTKEVQ